MLPTGITARLLVLIGIVFGIALDRGTIQGQTNSPKADPQNLVLLDIKKGFQVISIPVSGVENANFETRSVPTKRYLYGNPVGVFGGHLLSLFAGSSYSREFSGKLLATDLKDGTVRVLVSGNVAKAKCVAGQLYLVSKLALKSKGQTHKLIHIDLETLESTEVCNLNIETAMFGSGDIAIEVAPDGQTVAVSDMKKPAEPADQIMARIIFAKPGSSETVKTQYSFRTITVSNGAGHFLKAPEFFWLDNGRLLFGGYATDGSKFKLDRGIRIMPMNGEPMKVSLIQANDGTISDICKLPNTSFPEFVAINENRVTVHLRRLGLHDVDIESGLVSETTFAGTFVLADSKQPKPDKAIPLTSQEVNKLHERNWLLFDPKGKRLAWFSERSGIGNFGRHADSNGPDDKLYFYDPSRGHQLIYEGRVAASLASAISPSRPFAVWASAQEMEQSQKLMSLEEFKVEKPKTARKAKRPNVKDCLEISIQADKAVYQRHAPIELTISVKNVTGGNYRFEKRRVTENEMPFSIENKYSRGRSVYHLFDRDENVLGAEFLDLPPDETVEFQRTFEVAETGPQRFELEIRDWNIWSGSLTAETHFEVLETTTSDLLEQKFDRTLVACLNRWERTEGKAGLHASKFWQLGDEGADLLVKYLKTCDDGPLRNELTDGLRSTLSESAMDYLESRLSTDMQHDARNVVRCLSNMVSRAKWKHDADKLEEARKLLLAAGKHENLKARFAVLEKVRRATPDDVDDFMLETVNDVNDSIATIAARYVAVRQKLPLKRWLEYARNNRNRATELAVRSFTEKLSSQWAHELGLEKIQSELESNYEGTIDKLIQWCDRHPRAAAKFLDELPLRSNEWRPLPAKNQGKPIALPTEG